LKNITLTLHTGFQSITVNQQQQKIKIMTKTARPTDERGGGSRIRSGSQHAERRKRKNQPADSKIIHYVSLNEKNKQ
jgi:hypothetical protein